MIMIRHNSAAGILLIASLFVVSASGHVYGNDVQGDVESRLLASDMFYDYDYDNENADAMKVDSGSCATETYETQCQTAELGSDYPVHVCPTDDLTSLCYYSTVPTCCKKVTSVFKCMSVTNVQVGGNTASVTHYQREASGEICISFSPVVETCHGSCNRTCANVDCPTNLECNSNGTNCHCKEGFSEESECCACKEGYYPSTDGTTCKKFCRGNCETGRVSPDGQVAGPCFTCFRGYDPPDCCKCPPELVEIGGECKSECSKAQTLYFFIDATQSNKFENFCPLIYTMQMLVAAFNPSSTSETQIGAMLFADEAKKIEPSSVFSIGTSCHDAIQGEKNSLLSLMLEYGTCLDKDRKYSSPKYPSMCGEGTSALRGLKEIYEVISNKEKSGVVLMLTDGVINDDAMEREEVLMRFEKAGITIIGAGIGKASTLGDSMKDYTSINLIKEDPVELGIAIVNEMESQKVLCSDKAQEIVRNLTDSKGTHKDLFCRCHRTANAKKAMCANYFHYPTCGGDLSSTLQNFKELASLEQKSLAEEIVAAVEDVLERFDEFE